jgi:O-antigen/teichoic acid export membrane protein
MQHASTSARGGHAPPVVEIARAGRRPHEGPADLSTVARGGALNFAAAIGGALLQFALVVAVTRTLTAAAAGAFFQAVALFLILSNTAELGADTGLVRSIPRLRVLGRSADLRPLLVAGLAPATAAATLLAVACTVAAAPLADLLADGTDRATMASLVRLLAPALPLATAASVAIAATRGFGTMLPNALVDRAGKVLLQLVLVLAALAAGAGAEGVALAWALPFAAALAVSALWMVRLLGRAARDPSLPPRPLRGLAGEFWRFSAPRGLAGFVQVATLWSGTLVVGAMLSSADASVFTAATRLVLAASVASLAIVHVVGPKLSELLTAGSRGRARDVYQVATSWQVLIEWPLYLGAATFAPVLLRLFGGGYEEAAPSLVVMSLAMLLVTALGPVDVVLLMGGRSLWSLANGSVALALQIGLSVVLIPRYGVTGASVAVAIGLAYANVAPLVQVRAFLALHPFGPGVLVAAAAAGISFGGIGLALRALLGPSLPALAAYVLLAACAYAALAWRVRHRLELPLLAASLRRPRQNVARTFV